VTEREREFGLGLQTDKRPGEYAELARIAEDAGFDVVTTFNDLYYQPALPALLEIAGATERVRVGPSCLNPYTAHPVEIAGQIAALDLASRGRAFLGLAAGAWLGELGVAQSRPLVTLREGWEVVSRLLAGDRSGFDGEVFRLEAGRGLEYVPEREAVPLLVGSWSPRLMAFASAQRAELKLGGSANPAMVRLARERAPHARIVVGAVTVVDRDGERARALAREQAAMYLDVVRELDPTVDRALEGDDLLKLFAFAGTPEEIRAHADSLFEAGATRVEFGTPHGVDPRAAIQLLGSVLAR
jgi:5,10-methylenetetrahydromethanopterin reductase